MAKPLFVCLMRCGTWYKIGVAGNPEKRARDLQTGNPVPIEVVADVTPDYWGRGINAFQVERHAHRVASRYAKERRGEWFRFENHKLACDVYSVGVLPRLGRPWLMARA